MPWVARRHIQAQNNNNLMIPSSDSSQVFEQKFHVVQIQIPPRIGPENGSEAGSKWNVKFTNKKLNAQGINMEFDGVVFHYENKQSLEFSLVYFVNIELNWDDLQEQRRKREEFLPRTSLRRLHDTRSLHNPLKVHALQLTFILFLSSRRTRLLFIVNNPARDFVSAHILHHSPRTISTLISSAALVERKSHRWLCFFFEWGDSTPRKKVRLIYCNSARDHAKCFFTIHHWLSARNEQFSTKVAFSFQLLSWPIWSNSRETFGVSRAQTTNFLRFRK